MDPEFVLLELAIRKRELDEISSLIGKNIGLSKESTGKEYLNLAYSHDYKENEDGDTVIVYSHHNGNIEEYLSNHCQYALEAHRLVQEKQEAKKRLGVAKARVDKLSNLLYNAFIENQKQQGDLIA